jgi:tetratricopeptide (TPR) repeat protein
MNRGSALALLAIVSASVVDSQTPVAPPGAAMERKFEAAMAAQEKGNLEQAQALLEDLHRERADLFPVNESLGLLYEARERYKDALPLLEAATHEQPDSDVAHANFGAALYKVHRAQPALAEFKRAVHLNPSNASAWQSLGSLSMEENDPAEAANAFAAALKLTPDDPALQLDCATALLTAKRTAEARQILASFADPDQSARAQALLGEADERDKSYIEAGRHFNRAVELEPSEENAWLLGSELLRHWTFDAAAMEFKAAVAKFPDSKRMRLGLGAALFGDAKYPQAIPVFADLLAGDPDNKEFAGMLGISCTTLMSQPSPGCAALVRYAQAHPKDAPASAYAAKYIEKQPEARQGRAQVRALLDAALAADPKLAEAQCQMGTFLQDEGQWKESIPYLERAITLKPDYAIAHYHLSLAYWRSGRKPEAEAQMDMQKKYSRQQEDDLNRRLREIASFVVESPK